MQIILGLLALLLGVIFIIISIRTKDQGKRYVIFTSLSALFLLTLALVSKMLS